MIVLYTLFDRHSVIYRFFFFNDTATTEIYTLSLHDALPISALLPLYKTWKPPGCPARDEWRRNMGYSQTMADHSAGDRKSTRLNSSHANISYAVFCLKKKKKHKQHKRC